MKEHAMRGLKFFVLILVTFFALPAFADGDAGAVADSGWKALSAALAIGLAAFGGSLGQARAAASALEGIARNPGAKDAIFTPMIISLALIESLVIYAFLISFMIKP